MRKLWEFIIDGCWHDWQFHGNGPLTRKGQIVGIYTRYYCRKCQLMRDRNEL